MGKDVNKSTEALLLHITCIHFLGERQFEVTFKTKKDIKVFCKGRR